ncbi:hypothetical protein Q1695_004658 [Nippostrongylus brasiliensis]|nr:hypothetical protein Q1695_004658 [Nippostrongylus brasiliensis]
MKAFAKFLQKSLIVYWLAVVHIKHADGFGFCCMDHNKINHDRVSSVQLIYTVDYGKKDLWTVFHKDVSKRLTQSVECEIYLENTRKEWEKFKFSNALSQYRNLVITVACFCNMSDICHESPETFADFVSHLPDEEATFYKNNVLPAIKPPFKQDEPEPTDTTKYATTSFAIPDTTTEEPAETTTTHQRSTHESPEVTTASHITEVQVHHSSPTATTTGEEPPIEVPHDDKYRRETPPPQEDDLQRRHSRNRSNHSNICISAYCRHDYHNSSVGGHSEAEGETETYDAG